MFLGVGALFVSCMNDAVLNDVNDVKSENSLACNARPKDPNPGHTFFCSVGNYFEDNELDDLDSAINFKIDASEEHKNTISCSNGIQYFKNRKTNAIEALTVPGNNTDKIVLDFWCDGVLQIFFEESAETVEGPVIYSGSEEIPVKMKFEMNGKKEYYYDLKAGISYISSKDSNDVHIYEFVYDDNNKNR